MHCLTCCLLRGARDSRSTTKDLSLRVACLVGCVWSEVTQGEAKKNVKMAQQDREVVGGREGDGFGLSFPRELTEVSSSLTPLL